MATLDTESGLWCATAGAEDLSSVAAEINTEDQNHEVGGTIYTNFQLRNLSADDGVSSISRRILYDGDIVAVYDGGNVGLFDRNDVISSKKSRNSISSIEFSDKPQSNSSSLYSSDNQNTEYLKNIGTTDTVTTIMIKNCSPINNTVVNIDRKDHDGISDAYTSNVAVNRASYDSDDSGTVSCVADSSSDEGISACDKITSDCKISHKSEQNDGKHVPEGLRGSSSDCSSNDDSRGNGIRFSSLEERFGHLFLRELPVPLERRMTHFVYLTNRKSKRRAPLPPSFIQHHQQEPETHHMPQQWLHSPKQKPRGMPRTHSSISLEVKSDSRNSATLRRKSMKRRLSLVALVPSSKFNLSKLHDYFVQTAPGKLQLPSRSKICHENSSSVDVSSVNTVRSSSSSGSVQSFSTFGSFSPSSNFSRSNGSGAYFMVVPTLEESSTSSESRGHYDGLSLSSSAVSIPSSWGMSSFSSLQTVDSRDASKERREDIANLPPSSSSTSSAELVNSKYRTEDLHAHLIACLQGSVQTRKPEDTHDRPTRKENQIHFNASPNKTCSSIVGVSDKNKSLLRKTNACSFRTKTSGNITGSMCSFGSGKKEDGKSPTFCRRKSLRHWWSSLSLANDSDLEDTKHGSHSKMNAEEPNSSNEFAGSNSFGKSRSDTALNRLLDQVNFEAVAVEKNDLTSLEQKRTYLSQSMSELHVKSKIMNMSDCHTYDDISKLNEEKFLRHTRVVVLPEDTHLTEPPIYENVTCVIKPRLPKKLDLPRLRQSLPPRPKSAGTRQLTSATENKLCNTIITKESNSLKIMVNKSSQVENICKNPSKQIVKRNYSSDSSREAVVLDEETSACNDKQYDKSRCSESSFSFAASDCTVSFLSKSLDLDQKNLVNETNRRPEELSPTLAELSGKKIVDQRQKCFLTMKDSSYSQPASPVLSRQCETPRPGGSVRDLINKFSSMDNLSTLNSSVPKRTLKSKFVKAKMGVKNVNSYDMQYSKTCDISELKNKYKTWDKNVSRELRKSASNYGKSPDLSYSQLNEHITQNFSTVVSISEDMKSSIVYKELQSPKNVSKNKKDQFLISPSHEDIYQEDEYSNNGDNTLKVTDCTAMKPLQNNHSDSDAIVINGECESTIDCEGRNEDLLHRETSEVAKIDLIGIRESRRRRLSLNMSLCAPQHLQTHEEEMTFGEQGHKSLEYLAGSREKITEEYKPKYARINRHYEHNKNNFYLASNQMTNIKKSPFQKLKETLFNQFHQTTTVPQLNTDIQEDHSKEHYDIFQHPFHKHSQESHLKPNKTKSYIQLKSLRTWKDVTKVSKKNSAPSGISSDASGNSYSHLSSKGSSKSSSPTLSNQWTSSSASGMTSDFSSNPSSKASSLRSSSPEGSSGVIEVSYNHTPISFSSDFRNAFLHDQHWKFNPLCCDDMQAFLPSLESSSIHDLDRSITYASHQPNKVCPSQISSNLSSDSNHFSYFGMFHNPKDYFKPTPFSFSLNCGQDCNDDGTGIYEVRRHSLTDFSPEIKNNDGSLAKKLTPSSLYPMTLSPNSPFELAAPNPCTTSTKCNSLLNETQMKGHHNLSSQSLPLRSPPSVELGPPSSVDVSSGITKKPPPHFSGPAEFKLSDRTNMAMHFQNEMPAPMRYTGLFKNRSFLHCVPSDK